MLDSWGRLGAEQHQAHYLHDANSVKFDGLTHHDVAVRYISGYMHMAYDPSTPTDICAFYHQLACNDIVGPNLGTEIGDTIPILSKESHLTAMERLKNYNPEDIDFGNFDGCHTQSYTPIDECDERIEEQMLEKERNHFYGMTQESTELMFDESINNADIPLSMSGRCAFGALAVEIFS